MKNIFTCGTAGISLLDRHVLFPANEDWGIAVEIVEIEGNFVFGFKVWDSSKKVFSAICSNPSGLTVGGHSVFYRIGTEEESFICVPFSNEFVIEDDGNGFAHDVKIDKNGVSSIPVGSVSLPLMTLDPVSHYHNNHPPFLAGRRYFAQKTQNAWLVDLPGFGTKTKTFKLAGSALVDLDSEGNIVGTRSISDPILFAHWDGSCYRYNFANLAWEDSSGISTSSANQIKSSETEIYANDDSTLKKWSGSSWVTTGANGNGIWGVNKTGQFYRLQTSSGDVIEKLAGTTWSTVYTATTGAKLYGIAAIGENVCAVGALYLPSGYTASDALICYSNDGGTNWNEIVIPRTFHCYGESTNSDDEVFVFTDVYALNKKFIICGYEYQFYRNYTGTEYELLHSGRVSVYSGINFSFSEIYSGMDYTNIETTLNTGFSYVQKPILYRHIRTNKIWADSESNYYVSGFYWESASVPPNITTENVYFMEGTSARMILHNGQYQLENLIYRGSSVSNIENTYKIYQFEGIWGHEESVWTLSKDKIGATTYRGIYKSVNGNDFSVDLETTTNVSPTSTIWGLMESTL